MCLLPMESSAERGFMGVETEGKEETRTRKGLKIPSSGKNNERVGAKLGA